jgi:uncharacterized metal-binding protein
MNDPLPLVYSCSGCSSSAQMANWLAVRLDREGLVEMSCIAGVGGDVVPLVKAAQQEKPRIVIDGCPLACAKACLARHHLDASAHINLLEWGVPKKLHEDFDPVQATKILDRIKKVHFKDEGRNP